MSVIEITYSIPFLDLVTIDSCNTTGKFLSDTMWLDATGNLDSFTTSYSGIVYVTNFSRPSAITVTITIIATATATATATVETSIVWVSRS